MCFPCGSFGVGGVRVSLTGDRLAGSYQKSITSVEFSGSSTNYTLTVNGTGFGSLQATFPFNGDSAYFRIADAAQIGMGAEWGYTGDGKTLTYQSWSDTQIQVSGFRGQPGDAITMAVWNPTSGAGATWGGNVPGGTGVPQITSVAFSSSGQALQIIVNGSGFGNGPAAMPFIGDLNYFAFGDFGTHCGSGSSLFSAGFGGWGVVSASSITMDYQLWSDSEIVISGFAGSYGQSCPTLQVGDPVVINVWSTTDTNTAGTQTAWGGFVVTNSPVDSVGDGIPDWWREAYFGGGGTNTNSVSCAACDADGTGQNNLFKYVAGLNPTNPASVFVLNIASATNQPSQNDLFFTPLALGRTYTPEFSTNLVGGVWLPLTTYTGLLTNGNQVTITDTNPIPPQEFYRIGISLP